jgi:hypothetical protein
MTPAVTLAPHALVACLLDQSRATGKVPGVTEPDSVEPPIDVAAPALPPGLRPGMRIQIWTTAPEPTRGRLLALEKGMLLVRMDGPLTVQEVPLSALERVQVAREKITPSELVRTLVTGAIGGAAALGLNHFVNICFECEPTDEDRRHRAVRAVALGGFVGLGVGLVSSYRHEQWRDIPLGRHTSATLSVGRGVRGALSVRF